MESVTRNDGMHNMSAVILGGELSEFSGIEQAGVPQGYVFPQHCFRVLQTIGSKLWRP